jgi:ATP-binding cassette, subfamily C (CFTR/MRP), member 1
MVLTAGERASFSRGFVYNLVTSDTDNIQQMCNQVFTLLSAPLRICVAMALLYAQLGSAAFAALALLILVIPLQVCAPSSCCPPVDGSLD